MRPGRKAGAADVGDDVARLDCLALMQQLGKPIEMGVERHDMVVVAQPHEQTGGSLSSAGSDGATCRSPHRRSPRCSKIDAVVEPADAQDRMDSPAKTRGDPRASNR